MQTYVQAVLARRDLAPRQAPSPRERWHALWLPGNGRSAAAISHALDRDPHTIGVWLDAFRRDGPATLTFEHTGGSPRPRPRCSSGLKVAVQVPPQEVGIDLAAGIGRWCASSSKRASTAA
jgi:hypothetical protein